MDKRRWKSGELFADSRVAVLVVESGTRLIEGALVCTVPERQVIDCRHLFTRGLSTHRRRASCDRERVERYDLESRTAGAPSLRQCHHQQVEEQSQERRHGSVVERRLADRR